MLQGLSLRVSWICLLLISSAAGFPATKEDYKYPYSTSASSDDASPRSGVNAPSQGSHSSLPSLQYAPSAVQQPGAALQHPGSPSGIQSPSAPSGAPSRFVFPASSSGLPSRAPVSFSGLSQPGVGSAGSSNFPIFSAPSRPAVGLAAPSRFVQPASYAAPAHQAAPVSYEAPAHQAAPVSYEAPAHQAAPVSYEAPAHQAAPVSYEAPASQAVPVNFVAAPSSFSFEGFSSAPLPWPAQPTGFDGSFAPESWIPSRSFPDFSVWGSEEEVGAAPGFGGGKGKKGVQYEEEVEEIAPQASSSYITQSRNGYLRARELVSHMSYVPEEPEAPVIYYELVQKTQQAAPQAPAKGGKKF